MADSRLEHIFRVEAPRVRARLVGEFGDFDLAEELVQDASVKALENWPRTGVPDNPAAWLFTVARRRAIDRFRHREVQTRITADFLENVEPSRDADSGFDDDVLRLIFTCCHPSLGLPAQSALTLKTVVGLSLEQVARAFLLTPRALEQRLVRAKRKIKQAGIPFEIPEEQKLAERLTPVLTVVYLIFNEGYAATDGDALLRRELCREAIRLMRIITRLLRRQARALGGHGRLLFERAESVALLSLMLLQDSRAAARVDDAGRIVLLAEQNRALWDRRKIQEGTALLDKVLALRPLPGPFQIQAAIAALHANAASAQDTDWREITALYDRLLRHTDTPVVRLNRAVAVFMSGRQDQGLALAQALADEPSMRGYPLYHSAVAGLLRLKGDTTESLASYEIALRLVQNDAQRQFLEERIAEMRCRT